MFSIPRANVIESDEGFSVEVVGPAQVKYTEENKILFIASEYLEGPSGLVIYKNSIKQWSDGLEINEVEKEKIVNNIRKAFRYRNIEIEVF
jgi:hypothetical protein